MQLWLWKSTFFLFYMPLISYVLCYFHHFNWKFLYLRHWWDNHFGAITWSFFLCPWFLYNEELQWWSFLLPSPQFSWVWKDIITNALSYKNGHKYVKCCSVVVYSLFTTYMLWFVQKKNELCRHFPERVNVQVRILCNISKINFLKIRISEIQINSKTLLHTRCSYHKNVGPDCKENGKWDMAFSVLFWCYIQRVTFTSPGTGFIANPVFSVLRL